MPFLEIITNITLTRAQAEELALSLSAFAAETLKMPQAAFGINVRANEVLTFAGNWDPCTPSDFDPITQNSRNLPSLHDYAEAATCYTRMYD